MRYVGGKERIAGWVAAKILHLARDYEIRRYAEPFVGSGAVFRRVAPKFKETLAADGHPDLILMWQALVAGWVPPDTVSKEEYDELREDDPSALRGFAGFGASFGGKWFVGHVDWKYGAHWNKDTNKRSVLMTANAFKNAEIVHTDYLSLSFGAGDLVYCDPPYEGTEQYKGVSFRYSPFEFWWKADQWVKNGAIVIVSEEKAPSDWPIIGIKVRKAALQFTRKTSQPLRIECIFHKPPNQETTHHE